MKRILAVVLTSVLLTGGSVSAVSANATTEALPVSQMETVAEMQNNLYLVPGTYMSGGVKVENVRKFLRITHICATFRWVILFPYRQAKEWIKTACRINLTVGGR